MWQWIEQAISLFDNYKIKETDFDVISYEFDMEQNSLLSIKNVNANDINGLVNVSIGQNIERQDIFWHQMKIITILGRVGGQAIAVIAIC